MSATTVKNRNFLNGNDSKQHQQRIDVNDERKEEVPLLPIISSTTSATNSISDNSKNDSGQ